jgi:hypothetical protein
MARDGVWTLSNDRFEEGMAGGTVDDPADGEEFAECEYRYGRSTVANAVAHAPCNGVIAGQQRSRRHTLGIP